MKEGFRLIEHGEGTGWGSDDEGGKYCFGDWDKGCHYDDEVERYDNRARRMTQHRGRKQPTDIMLVINQVARPPPDDAVMS